MENLRLFNAAMGTALVNVNSGMDLEELDEMMETKLVDFGDHLMNLLKNGVGIPEDLLKEMTVEDYFALMVGDDEEGLKFDEEPP